MSYGELDAFDKRPKKSIVIEESGFIQLDFPVNHAMYTFDQLKLGKNFKHTDELKKMKIHFRAILCKKEEDIRSSLKIVKIISITPDAMFE